MRLRDYRASLIVAALSGAFGAALVIGTGVMADAITANSLSSKDSVKITVLVVASVFFAIAVYVSAVVTANTVATVIAGRIREIALYRLIGAASSRLRLGIAREGLVVAAIGALLGTAVVFVAGLVIVPALVAGGVLPEATYTVADPLLIAPTAVTIAMGFLSSWAGSQRVGQVTPIQALGVAAADPTRRMSGARRVFAALFLVSGLVALAGGVVLGLTSPLGVLVGLVGGIVSFTGVVMVSPVLMPALLRLTGGLLGRGPVGRIAAANAVRYPERSARSMVGVVIGVTLVTMFAVASSTYVQMMLGIGDEHPEYAAEMDQVLTMTLAIFSGLFGFSALIAAVGLVNNLALGVIQRGPELGLLRTLGFTTRQIRRMIVAESLQMTLASTVFGVLLGIFYGWAGAQATLGAQLGQGLVVPTIPWAVIGTILGLALAVGVLASLAPSRHATRGSAVAALSAD
ncbi:ABC transporter permease [Mycetocola tolaasinivorans]|uniref:ABC transporter permease n=2 Tax=Mycetocola tolaasinivorans TaxID=76635 RepID=A0A3L7A9K5_9MICO|nr:ABC transporter permease [Mycetocola tolaasinivorans]